jgi:ABC-type sugar transport system ATPase subunit
MEGRIAQVGTPSEVFARPATTAVATFIGSPAMNLLPGRIERGLLHIAGAILVAPAHAGPDGDVIVGIRPGSLRIESEGLAARVELVENLGDNAIVDCIVGEHTLKWRVDGTVQPREGDAVRLFAPPEALHLFDPSSGQRRA